MGISDDEVEEDLLQMPDGSDSEILSFPRLKTVLLLRY
jgi:hypothetical protein